MIATEPSRLSRREVLALLAGTTFSSLYLRCAPSGPPIPTSDVPVDDIHFQSLTEAARLIESKQISPVELTQIMLERITAIDSKLHSYLTVMADSALAAARVAEEEIQSGNYRGPLHGVPIAVKDLCYTRGVRTTGALAVLVDFVPDYDATVVSKLASAGAVLLGKLNLTEGAMAGYNRKFEVPVNPWGDELWAGVSSSGSGVATAAGLCFASLGTDTGGSIRYPSMANGIVGLKPTYGRVSRYGILTLADTLDHVGPMTRSVADAAAVLQVIAGHDPNDETSLSEPVPDMVHELTLGVQGLRIGFNLTYVSEGVDPNLVASIETAVEKLESLGASIVDIEMPDSQEVRDAWFPICAYEALAAHRAHFPARADEYGGYFRDFLEFGSTVTNDEYARLSDARAKFSERFRSALSTVDAVVFPPGGVPSALPKELYYDSMAKMTPPLLEIIQPAFIVPADFAGTPTLSLPCGFSTGELPYTIQLLGSALSEAMLCRIGHAYEQATDWHQRHPDV